MSLSALATENAGNGTGVTGLSYLLSDHLGSTSLTAEGGGTNPTTQLYKAWGEVRYSSGSLPTRYTFTGQYTNMPEFGLMYFGARWLDPYLNRWTQPDSIIPDPYNPLDWDRYQYVRSNPVKYTDPTGHCALLEEDADGLCVHRNTNGALQIVRGGDVFRNHVEKALGNLILSSGDPRYLNQVPAETPGFMVGAAFENACEGLGLDCGNYYRTSIFIWSAGVLNIAGARYRPLSSSNIPGSITSDALGDPDCPGCGYDPWAGDLALRQNVENTLSLIDTGGPFPYRRDGTVFRNNNGLLPPMPLGYYREYTVPTPGGINRGAVRLVVGQNGEIYYTADHYRSFVRIR